MMSDKFEPVVKQRVINSNFLTLILSKYENKVQFSEIEHRFHLEKK